MTLSDVSLSACNPVPHVTLLPIDTQLNPKCTSAVAASSGRGLQQPVIGMNRTVPIHVEVPEELASEVLARDVGRFGVNLTNSPRYVEFVPAHRAVEQVLAVRSWLRVRTAEERGGGPTVTGERRLRIGSAVDGHEVARKGACHQCGVELCRMDHGHVDPDRSARAGAHTAVRNPEITMESSTGASSCSISKARAPRDEGRAARDERHLDARAKSKWVPRLSRASAHVELRIVLPTSGASKDEDMAAGLVQAVADEVSPALPASSPRHPGKEGAAHVVGSSVEGPRDRPSMSKPHSGWLVMTIVAGSSWTPGMSYPGGERAPTSRSSL